MAVTEEIIAALRAEGQAAFQRAMDTSARSVEGVGEAAKKSGQQVKDSGADATKATPRWKTMGKTVAKWAGGAAALYGAKRGIEASMTATQDLGKATLTLQRATGMDVKQASSWASVLKSRGIETGKFQIGMVKLSKTMEAARGGNDKAAKSLAALGVNQDQIAKGDISGALFRVADAFQGMNNPAEKAAAAQNLFGRSGQQLVPLLNSGSKGLNDQLNMAQKYGATLSGKSVGAVKEMIAQQREQKMAMEGVKVTLGQALLPLLLSLSKILLQITQVMQPLLRNTTLLKIVIAAVAIAFTAYKVAVLQATLAQAGLNVAILPMLGWAALVIGIAAAFYLLYTKVGWFRNAVQAVWGWIKSNWPLLLAILTGPFGLATLAIIKNFDKIKKAASDVVSWIANRFRDLINFFKRLPGAILSAIGDIGGKLKSKFESIKGGGVPFVPGIQHGGTVTHGGTALVGEAGPELVHLPRAASVIPLTPAAIPAPAIAGGHTTANFYLDRRLVATAVAQADSDQRARR